MVAMAYAARHPDHPAKLILQSTMGRLEVGRIVEDFRRAGGDEAAEAAQGYWSLDRDLDAMAAYATTCLPLYGSGSSDPNRLSRGELNLELLMDPVRVLHDMDLLPGLAAVRCPTLVIAGEEDPLCGVTPMQDVVDALPADLVRFEQLPNSGHYVSRDESERFFTLVRDFVAG
jgi:proline iminopeptidase